MCKKKRQRRGELGRHLSAGLVHLKGPTTSPRAGASTLFNIMGILCSDVPYLPLGVVTHPFLFIQPLFSSVSFGCHGAALPDAARRSCLMGPVLCRSFHLHSREEKT